MTLFESSQFLVRLTSRREDIERILELRSECFGRVFNIDEFELLADHLIVEDRVAGQIVGAYRLCSSTKMSEFESELEFDMQDWLKKPGNRVELGWACTRAGYREGVVIRLLWNGLSQYIKHTEVTAVFGSSSVIGDSVDELKSLLHYLEKNQFELKEKSVRARSHYDLTPQLSSAKLNRPFIKRQLPALMRAYLMAGALVLLQPIFDPDCNCFDLMTILELNQTSKVMKNHFDL